jgi:hypothetical protein
VSVSNGKIHADRDGRAQNASSGKWGESWLAAAQVLRRSQTRRWVGVRAQSQQVRMPSAVVFEAPTHSSPGGRVGDLLPTSAFLTSPDEFPMPGGCER